MTTSQRGAWEGSTAATRHFKTPFRQFLRTETGSAAVLLVASLAAVAWVNIHPSSYTAVWDTRLLIRVGDASLDLDLRKWINSGLMAFFFFVVGLEARRELDLGELRERRRLALPLLAGLGGMAVPVLVYLAINAGHGSGHGWGAAMSTDTAFALGMLALVGPRCPDRLRAFLLTVVVVDDVVALLVIATAYSEQIALRPLLVAIGLFAAVLAVRALGIRRGLIYAVLGIAIWVALVDSGVDPVVVGLVMGLLTVAYPAARSDLERATERFRLFREQPTPELARQARAGMEAALSPNDRLQQLYHSWTSYLIVPLFALANAGIPLDREFLARALTSPITVGILVGYVVGKPLGVVATCWLATRTSRGRLRPPVGWAAVAGGGTIAGIGFTVSLLIASLAFRGPQLEEAKAGVLGAALIASATTWLIFRVTDRLSPQVRVRALLGASETLVDLADPVYPERDHIRGPLAAPVTLVEYGDLECPYCGRAEPVVRKLLADYGDLRYVWRHLPLTDVHPHAQLAAEATEAAGAQDAFWRMHDLLFAHQDTLRFSDLVRYATELGLDVDRFTDDLQRRVGATRVASDVESADLSGVSGTPTFFINGRRHFGAFDIETLSAAVRAAGARALVASRPSH
jgi:Na+/H+ antiporter NhaA